MSKDTNESEDAPGWQRSKKFDAITRNLSDRTQLLFEQAMSQTRMAVSLADPSREDCPLIFCNRAFEELTGYDANEILGRNCRFLQGRDTDPAAVERIREAIRNDDVTLVEILNYRKDGTTFWNALHIGPIFDEEGRLQYIFGSQWDVTDVHAARAEERHARLMEREISHRMKNMFSVISAIVSMLGRQEGAPVAMIEDINNRIRALGRAHEATLGKLLSGGPSDPRRLFQEIVAPYALHGLETVRLEGGPIPLDAGTVSVLTLILNELAANALKYGALSVEDGTIAIRWRSSTDAEGVLATVIHWTEEGGPPLDGAPETSGSGADIIRRMLAAAGGRMDQEWHQDGFRAEIVLPTPGPVSRP